MAHKRNAEKRWEGRLLEEKEKTVYKTDNI